MQRWWWVNHTPTARREIAGGYLWSPRIERGGARSPFYDNMRRAGPGDLILSYAAGRLRHVGRVVDYAVAAEEPAGGEGREGWWLAMRWTALQPPVCPREVIGALGPLLPGRYSPIDPATGLGRQKAYLTEIGEAAFAAALGGSRFEAADLEAVASPAAEPPPASLDDAVERAIAADPSLSATQKRQLVVARRGQGVFRDNVRALEPACRVTGVANPWLLIASHIKPWRACASAAERLDGANGLLLAPHVDLLFDRGFISFEDRGGVLVSPRIGGDDLARLGLRGLTARSVRPFADRQARYLDWHRQWVFLS